MHSFTDAAAALAAVSMVFKNEDPIYASQALQIAEKVYQFATLESDSPHSYCDFVPCSARIPYMKQVIRLCLFN